MITRLRVKGFKSLYDLDVTFSPLTVLFGTNTSGKSNILDVIQLLAKSVTAEHIADIFDAPFRGSGFSCFSLEADGQNRKNKIEIRVDLKLSPRMLLEAARDRFVPGADADLYAASECVSCVYNLDLEISDIGALMVSYEALFFSGSTGIYDGFSGNGNFTTLLRQYNGESPYIRAAQKEIASWRVFSLDPQDSLRAVNEEFRPNANLGPKGEKLASFLYTLKIRDAFQWETFQKAVHLYIPEITALDVRLNQHGEVDLFVVEGGHRISIRLISDGTLNLMGLLAMVDTNNPRGVIGIDEPENGLHPSRMGLLARFLETQAMDNQQLIVTTHSPYLLDHLPLDSLYVCQKENGKTGVRPVTDFPVMSCLNEDILLSDLMASGVFNG